MTPVSDETDYLVIGGGATANVFVDTLLGEQPQATVTIVDRRHRPGGHWNDAYPFVRLHQPSAWYGVASQELASGNKDTVGPNRRLYSLASGPEGWPTSTRSCSSAFCPQGGCAGCR
jgi:cation diffusion facilitator CzcD-associated flavoprotein CzcO